jgi:hypothetical protein
VKVIKKKKRFSGSWDGNGCEVTDAESDEEEDIQAACQSENDRKATQMKMSVKQRGR